VTKGKNLKSKTPPALQTGFKIKIGDYLLSHPVAQAVPSAFRGLTSLFGMGRGVTPWL
jgi:hypothetical protein